MITSCKELYPVVASFQSYLHRYGRHTDIPLVYDDLLRFTGAVPYENPSGRETLWLSVFYAPDVMAKLREQLLKIYCQLKIGGDMSMMENLVVERIDFAEFGNSNPFRIKITNKFNDVCTYYYVKNADPNRLFGLELEHLLSPNKMNYLIRENTLIEEHIAGVPGVEFLSEYIQRPYVNLARIAKEFIKFNERCFMRLLGDMRAVNYVVDITPDFEEIQYQVRAIDFDQQSYERHLKVYMPYRFSCNSPMKNLVFECLNRKAVAQYLREEHRQMVRRASQELRRMTSLLNVLKEQQLTRPEYFEQLKKEISWFHRDPQFREVSSMAELTIAHLRRMLSKFPSESEISARFVRE